MQKGKGFLALIRNGWLAIVLVACLLVMVVCLAGGAGKEAQSSRLEVEPMGAIEAQAWQLAANVVGTRKGVQQQFVDELLELYHEARDSDLVFSAVRVAGARSGCRLTSKGEAGSQGLKRN